LGKILENLGYDPANRQGDNDTIPQFLTIFFAREIGKMKDALQIPSLKYEYCINHHLTILFLWPKIKESGWQTRPMF